MSANDVRRGPGWWMDLDGGWNPPETWPEDSPPLPGWTRNFAGRWEPPPEDDGAATGDAATESKGGGESVANGRTRSGDPKRPKIGLSYTDQPSVALAPRHRNRPSTRTALLAALVAAVLAIMIATGLIVLTSML